jgi:hypothetical protein
VLVFFVAPLGVPFANTDTKEGVNPSSVVQTERYQDLQKIDDGSINAADPISGVLDPVTVEQYGYSGTGLLDARTDSGLNDQSSIPIDNATGWVGSQAELEIWDMKRQYAENGTLDDGVDGTTYYPNSVVGYPYGWDFEWDDPSYGGPPGEQNVSTAYDKDEGYIILQTEGQLDTSSGYVEYRHYDGTYIYWNQTIENVPYSDNLTLSFMFNYESGIIDILADDIEGWVWLDVLIDGSFVDYINLMNDTECPSRNTWYEFVVANITNAPATFNLEIGVSIMTWYVSDSYYLTNPGGDYDEDGVLDFDHTRVNRVLLDNITLLSVTQPSYEAVDLTFNAGVFSTSITEFVNYGTATISNPGYWGDNSLPVGVTANVSISCDYEVKLLSHNFGNSMWASEPTKEGVGYTADAGASVALTSFTYVGSEGVVIYENFTVELYLPPDWENVTVFDPFLNDVTGLCTFTTGSLEIPTSILDRLGWWQLTLESPNYAESVSAQIYDGGWTDSTLYRPGNLTRLSVTLGTVSETPIISDPVNVTWFYPDDSVWSQDSPTTGIGGVVNTAQRTLGGANTTAGVWSVVVVWTNGTEFAYGSTTFDMYHTASLVVPAQYTTIQTDVGLIISNFVYFTDADTSDYLLDDSVTITANWTGSTIPFTQDLVKNWWRGEFDTSLVEGGQYTVVVTASRPFFDDVSTQFIVIATQQMTLEITNAGAIPIERGLNEVFTVQMEYGLLNGTRIPGAVIDVSHSGPGGGLSWYNFVDHNNGHYSVDISCDLSATYPITITLNRTYYHAASDDFTLQVEEIDTSIEGSSPLEALYVGRSYQFMFSYLIDSNSSYIFSANVVPSGDGADWVTYTELVSGQYAVNLTPTEVGEFYVNLKFEKVGFESASYNLVFIVDRVPMSVEILDGNNGPELQTKTLRVSVNETDTGTPVSGAQVFCWIIDPNGAPGDSIRMNETSTAGVYSATIIMPIAEGVYHIQISCVAENFVLDEPLFAQLYPERDLGSMLFVTTLSYWPFIVAVGAACFGLVYRRSARKRRIRQNKITLAIKRRFDDVRNLLGVIVIHKDSGLPIYSKILRDGLEEAVISAFITAVTSFRGEFDIESTTEEWGLIPISDIVRVVSTEKLICAFITTSNPSPEQRERMIQFAKTVGFIFDDTMEEVPIVVLDHHTTMQFDSLFDDILDGALLGTYKLDDDRKFPTSTCADERIARKHGEEFKLEELATEIAACGLEEGRVYQAIMKALDNQFLVTTEDSPFATELLRAPEPVEEEG